MGKGGPGGLGEKPSPAAGGEGRGCRRSPGGSSLRPQARRWDLQQSLQETPGPVVRQEISALSDGQAGRVRLSARSFPRGGRWWALEGTKRIGPPLGMPCAGGGAGLGGTRGDVGVYRGHPEPQPPATAAGELPEQRKPGSSAGVTGGFLGVTRPCAHMCV